MTRSYNIRAWQPSDRAAVITLWRACGLVRPWNDPAQDIDLCIASKHGDILIACDPAQSEQICGAVMVGHDGHRGWVYYLAVAPNQRGCGLGRDLMAAAEKWVWAHGIRKLELMVRADNHKVRDFYRRCAYEQADVIIMQRWLDGTDPAAGTNTQNGT